MAQTVKRLPTMWETRVQSLGQEDPLEKEMATHSSILAWKIPWTEDPGRIQSVCEVAESDTTEQLHFHFHRCWGLPHFWLVGLATNSGVFLNPYSFSNLLEHITKLKWALWLVNILMNWEGDILWFHGTRGSCAWDLCPKYLFKWLFICILYKGVGLKTPTL